MRKNRFDTLLRFIHFANNEEINEEKMYKLRPLLSHLNDRSTKHFVAEQHLSYDEAMIKYFGYHES